MDTPFIAWDPIPTSAAAPEREAGLPGTQSGGAVVVLRTTLLVVLATVAIMVLLPAALAAQAIRLG